MSSSTEPKLFTASSAAATLPSSTGAAPPPPAAPLATQLSVNAVAGVLVTADPLLLNLPCTANALVNPVSVMSWNTFPTVELLSNTQEVPILGTAVKLLPDFTPSAAEPDVVSSMTTRKVNAPLSVKLSNTASSAALPWALSRVTACEPDRVIVQPEIETGPFAEGLLIA